ncbi:hypothetical protein NX059_007227 [Plenodomus lindquistii]|nr:hypothetical protein NX059_007227 [Plenodomus lindquistii]
MDTCGVSRDTYDSHIQDTYRANSLSAKQIEHFKNTSKFPRTRPWIHIAAARRIVSLFEPIGAHASLFRPQIYASAEEHPGNEFECGNCFEYIYPLSIFRRESG